MINCGGSDHSDHSSSGCRTVASGRSGYGVGRVSSVGSRAVLLFVERARDRALSQLSVDSVCGCSVCVVTPKQRLKGRVQTSKPLLRCIRVTEGNI